MISKLDDWALGDYLFVVDKTRKACLPWTNKVLPRHQRHALPQRGSSFTSRRFWRLLAPCLSHFVYILFTALNLVHQNYAFCPFQVLFPYDEFVKLFNWDKPGFPPCGLLNCGNRFALLTTDLWLCPMLSLSIVIWGYMEIFTFIFFVVALQMWFFSVSHSQGHLLPTCWRRATGKNVMSQF